MFTVKAATDTSFLCFQGGSETSVDETRSPAGKYPLDPFADLAFPEGIKSHRPSFSRHQYTQGSNISLGSDSPTTSGQTTPTLHQRGPLSSLLRDDDLSNVNRVFGLSPHGQLLICHCPPDAELPGFDRRDFT